MTNLVAHAYELGYVISPILLYNGIASGMPSSVLPIVSILEPLNFLTGVLSSGEDISLDKFFAHFSPLPGGSIIQNSVGMYPFANQRVAANAIIAEPVNISLLMYAPAKGFAGYVTKAATMLALQKTLEAHSAQGGSYIVATPSYIYTSCLLLALKDVSSGESKQAQGVWQWDFVQPLISVQEAEQTQNTLMSRISSQTQTQGTSWSGIGNTGGIPPAGMTPSIIPASTNLVGTLSAGGAGSAVAP